MEGRRRRETIKLAGRNLYEEYNQAGNQVEDGRRRRGKTIRRKELVNE